MRTCTLCKEEKSVEEFKTSNATQTWFRKRCKDCSLLGKKLFHTDDDMKLCRKCGLFKCLDQFGLDKNKADGLRTHCKECNSREYKKWYYKDTERSKLVSKEWRDKNQDKRKEMWNKYRTRDKELKLLKMYGITFDQYLLMLESQAFQCKICLVDLETISPKHIHVDHCHTTNKVRGILCNLCNTSIGMAREDIEILENMIKYLKENNETVG